MLAEKPLTPIGEILLSVQDRNPEIINDLLLEYGEKNHVKVIVHRAREIGKRLSYKSEMVYHCLEDSMGSQAMMPGLAIHIDSLRIAHGLKPRVLPTLWERLGGDLVDVSLNLRTNTGIDYVAAQLGGSASTTVANYIALSNNTNAANAANTAANTTNTMICWGTATSTDAAASTSRGEYTALGMARAAATYAHTTGSASTSFTQTKTFTATSACTAMQCCGLMNSNTQGTSGTGLGLILENTYTATTLATNDQLTIAWTINI